LNQSTVINEKVILIRINKLYHESMTQEELHEATRGIWKVGSRRNNVDYAFAVFKAIVKEVYKVHNWLPACTLEYKTRKVVKAIQNVNKIYRWEFEGEIAESNIRKKYIGKSVKNYLPSFGGANPITYVNC